MQKFCIVVYVLVIAMLKFIYGNSFNDNQIYSEHRLNFLNSLRAREIHKLLKNLENNENYQNIFKSDTDKIVPSEHDIVNFILAQNADNSVLFNRMIPNDYIMRAISAYIDSQRNTKSHANEYDDILLNRSAPNKRGLSMLSRWEPFKMTSFNSGNGRHVIRSPLVSAPSSNGLTGKIQIMGRPFRWG